MHRTPAHPTQTAQSRRRTSDLSSTASRRRMPFKYLARLAVLGVTGLTLLPTCTHMSVDSSAASTSTPASTVKSTAPSIAPMTTTSAIATTAPVPSTKPQPPAQPTKATAPPARSQSTTGTQETIPRSDTSPVTVEVQCATTTLTITFVPSPAQLEEMCRPYTPLPPSTPNSQTPVPTTAMPSTTATTQPPAITQPSTTVPQKPRPVSSKIVDAGCESGASLLRWIVTYSNGDQRSGIARFTFDETRVFVPEPTYLGTVKILFFAGKGSCSYSSVILVGW